MNTDITIPAAFYDYAYSIGIAVPQEQEIRSKGKGKQYLVLANDPLLAGLISVAEVEAATPKAPQAASARNFLLALRKQGKAVRVDVSARESKPVTRKTSAVGDRRNLIVTITPEGKLILRPAGRRRRVEIDLSVVYTLAVNAEARKAIATAKAKRKEKKAMRRAERDAAVIAFKANPTEITLR